MAETFDVVLYESEYREVSYNALAGMFLAADFAGVVSPSILCKDGDSLHLVHRCIPTDDFLLLEQATPPSPKNAPYESEQEAFTRGFPKLAPLLHKNIITGPKYNAAGETTSTLIATFNDEAVIQGFVAFFSAYKKFPVKTTILRNTQQKEWTPYRAPINIVADGPREDYVAPKAIWAVLPSCKEPVCLISPHRLGWKRRFLLDALHKHMTKLTPVCEGTISIMGLEAVGDMKYIVQVVVDPTLPAYTRERALVPTQALVPV
ncbi:Hypothetical protein POVN_LOCUS569 [uncultured virus]|nr:Hypothetical protein POVN_LOCUS569 [uncultured virus]